MKYFRKLIIGLALLILFAKPAFAQSGEAINNGLNYLKSQQQPTGQIAGFNGVSAWAGMAFSGAGFDLASISNGGSSLLDYLKNNPPAAGASATEWEREILAITAAGQNPFNFGGKNYVQALEGLANNSQIGDTNLINDDMFGLLALISAGDTTNDQIKQDSLNFILANQDPGGGFGYSKTSGPDIDTTAATIQALRAAQDNGIEHNNLSSAVNLARAYLLSGQNADGGFGYLPGEVSNASTTAWAEMALSSLSDTGQSIQKANDYLIKAQEENGSFKWQPEFSGDTFTSSYAVLALSGEYWPVKIFEEASPSPSPSANPSIIPSPMASPSPNSSPSIAPSPSTSASPSASPTASPSITPSAKPKPEIEFGFDFNKMYGKQRKLINRLREKQKEKFEIMRQKLEESLKNTCKTWGCVIHV